MSLEEDGKARHARVGVDIGGTFTDIVLVDDATGNVAILKVLTTKRDPAEAVMDGLNSMLSEAGAPASSIRQVRHGMTLVTNAVLQRSGGKVALVTTRGFGDLLEIGTEDRYDMYDLEIEKPKQIVGRRHVYEVDGRIRADGSVHTPLNGADMQRLAEQLESGGYEAVAVCLLHSYRNPDHERELGDFLTAALPEIELTLSADVSPQIREYHRASTTAINAYVMRLVKDYLGRLEDLLAGAGASAGLSLMLSNGGVCTAEVAATYPVRLIESGPAAGALAAAEIGALAGMDNAISFDMGGTTAKASLIIEGRPLFTNGLEVARQYRFKAGSGLPLQLRSVDLIEIGAGGGSIASLNELGLLQVGPASAGSEPGPACYGRGGALPTVTDADLILGYLNPGYFVGGSMELNVRAAEGAIARHIAEPMSVDVTYAADAIRRVVDENMASAFRIYALEHGYDPSSFPLIAFGGGGPVHAGGVARILGTRRIVIPPGAGVNSAYGLLAAPLAFDFTRSDPCPMDQVDWSRINTYFRDMEDEGAAILRRSGVPERDVLLTRLCDVRFVGQGTELSTEVPPGDLDRESGTAIARNFMKEYAQLYRHVPEDVPVEVISWRMLVTGPKSRLLMSRHQEDGRQPLKGTRRAFWGGELGFVETPVVDRYRLGVGDRFEGPLIVEERESTTLVDPAAALTVDENLNLIVDLVAGDA